MKMTEFGNVCSFPCPDQYADYIVLNGPGGDSSCFRLSDVGGMCCLYSETSSGLSRIGRQPKLHSI